MRKAGIHRILSEVLAEHTPTSTTCTCGHWTHKGYDEHLRDAVDEAFAGWFKFNPVKS